MLYLYYYLFTRDTPFIVLLTTTKTHVTLSSVIPPTASCCCAFISRRNTYRCHRKIIICQLFSETFFFHERKLLVSTQRFQQLDKRAPLKDLLHWQHCLDTFLLPLPEDVLRLSRLDTFLTSSSQSQRGRDKSRRDDETETARDIAFATRKFDDVGLGFLNEKFFSREIIVDGISFGTVYYRDMRKVLFDMLSVASPLNFATTAEPLMVSGSAAYAAPPTLPSWQDDQTRITNDINPILLRCPATPSPPTPTLLYLAIGSDATVVATTSPTSYYPLTIRLGNSDPRVAARHDAMGLWGFLPKPPKNMHTTSAESKEYSRRALIAHQYAADIYYAEVAKLRDGFFYEVSPGMVLWLVPRVGARTGDYPELQKWDCLHASALSHSPCLL